MQAYILIVDDQPDQLELMRAVIGMVDPKIQIMTAVGGNEALSLLRSAIHPRPLVILLDVKMPGKSGYEVLSELKADPALRRIPVCAFSSGDLERDICEFYDRGASCYFRKPYGIDNLKKFVEHFRSHWFEFASHCMH